MKTRMLFFIVLLSQVTFAGNIFTQEMSCKDLKNIIIEKKISSVDVMMKQWPKSYLKKSVLVYDSNALKTELVTFETPRIILFNEDGSLIASVSKHPGEKAIAEGKDSLEVICFNKETFLYEMFDLDMNGKDVPYLDFQPQKNPARCLSCHGSNPRPILQDYNAWPGIYGSFSQGGAAAEGSIEKEKFLVFLQMASGLPRYKDLDLSLVKPNPDDNEQPDLSKRDLIYQDTVDYQFAPVTQLGQLIQRNMEFRLASKMIKKLKSGEIKSIKSLLMYVGSDLNTCGPIRERITAVYDKVVEVSGSVKDAEEFSKNLKEVIISDFAKFKMEPFLNFNKVSEALDARGVLSIPNRNIVEFNDPFYPSNDLAAYLKQMALLQAISDFAGLTNEDWSSFPVAPTLGLGHIMRMGLYKDEQYILGLTEAMLAIDPFIIRRLENNCEDAKKYALEQAALLKINPEPTVFMATKK